MPILLQAVQRAVFVVQNGDRQLVNYSKILSLILGQNVTTHKKC